MNDQNNAAAVFTVVGAVIFAVGVAGLTDGPQVVIGLVFMIAGAGWWFATRPSR